MKKIRFVFLILLMACSGSKENKLILESIEIHKSSLKLSKEVANRILQMNTLVEESAEVEAAVKDSLAVLKQDFIDWDTSLVEMPGYEHDHHGHDHSGHDHAPAADLTPEMMLEIQKDLNNRILNLNVRAEKLLDKLNRKEPE